MALEDIEKLREKVAKDPNSKLFVPLADEYRKIGMFDEAISVLLSGLENQPGYVSARVSLGKVYLEKQMTAEAKDEFEKVISTIPDNLFAHKKLAEIYRDMGEREKAMGEYKTVLKLNPLDEEAVASLNELQSMPAAEESPVEAEPVPEELPEQEPVEVEEPEAEEVEIFDEEQVAQSVSETDFEEFKKTIAERMSGAEAAEAVAEEAVAEEVIEEPEKEASPYVELFKETKAAEAPQKEIKEKPVAEMPLEEEESVGEKPLRLEETPAGTLKDAELLVAGGNYSNAMKIYRGILSADPQNKQVLQKVEELRMLLKMLGKEQEALIDRLEAFGEGLKRRKDEFLRNP